MVLSTKALALGSALLFGALTVSASEASSNPTPSAPVRAFVNCPGINSVSMTADAEQALPLREVATLTCGAPVSVISDNEGYTAHIRTSDGKEGFVARMYLTNEASHAEPIPQPSHMVEITNATPENGVVRWNLGAPGCDRFVSKGRTVESIIVNGVTVQVSLQDTGWKLRATVAVSNQSGSNLFVLPNLITLDELKPNMRNLRAEDPAKLAHYQANHQVLRTEFNAQPSPSAVAYHGNSAPALASVNFHEISPTDFAGNYTDAGSVQSLALKTVNLAPGQRTAGVIWYVRDPNAGELSLRLSLGDFVYDFPFSFNDKK